MAVAATDRTDVPAKVATARKKRGRFELHSSEKGIRPIAYNWMPRDQDSAVVLVSRSQKHAASHYWFNRDPSPLHETCDSKDGKWRCLKNVPSYYVGEFRITTGGNPGRVVRLCEDCAAWRYSERLDRWERFQEGTAPGSIASPTARMAAFLAWRGFTGDALDLLIAYVEAMDCVGQIVEPDPAPAPQIDADAGKSGFAYYRERIEDNHAAEYRERIHELTGVYVVISEPDDPAFLELFDRQIAVARAELGDNSPLVRSLVEERHAPPMAEAAALSGFVDQIEYNLSCMRELTQ